ncbi:MAG TPA: MFS transporter, partial [Spongiibacteraceae bacterium]|nr:MFS transporter [Spongiibacteraceae bacterium]
MSCYESGRRAPAGTLQSLAYGALGLPLAFAALPIYVYTPHFYTEQTSISLAQLGLILLATRIFDAALDPLLGWCVDRIARTTMLLIALLPFAAGFFALFNPHGFFGA